MDCLVIRIDGQQVSVARFGVSGKSVALEGSALFELDGEQGLAAVASRIASGVSGSPRVLLCLPPDLFAQRLVELPLSDLRKVRQVLPAHLQGDMLLPAESALFDALPVSPGRYLALWAQHGDVAGAIQLFADAGLEPAVVSSAPFAWQYLPGIGADCALCDGSALALMSGGRISFLRALSGANPGQQLAATLSALELSGTALPARLYLFGPGGGELAGEGALPLPAEMLELPEECGHIFRNLQTFHRLADLYAVARACQAGALPDFRRGDLAWTAGDRQLRKKLRLTALLAAVTLLLLFGQECLRYRDASRDLVSLDSSIAALYREVFPGRARAVDELAEVRGEIRRLSGGDSGVAVLDLLKRLAELKGNGINGLYEAELEGNRLRLKGDAGSAGGVGEFRAALGRLAESVEVGELKSRPDGGVTFTMSALLREGKP